MQTSLVQTVDMAIVRVWPHIGCHNGLGKGGASFASAVSLCRSDIVYALQQMEGSGIGKIKISPVLIQKASIHTVSSSKGLCLLALVLKVDADGSCTAQPIDAI